MRQINYMLLLKKSWSVWKQYWLKLLVLNVLQTIVSVIGFVVLIGFEFGLLNIIGYNLSNMRQFLAALTLRDYVLLGFFALVDVVLLLAVASVFQGMKVGFYRDAVVLKAVDLKLMGAYVRQYALVLFKVNIIRNVLTIIPPILLALCTLAVFQTKALIVGGLAFSFLALLALALFFVFAFFFLDPLLARMKEHAKVMDMMKRSWEYSVVNRNRVGMTVLFLGIITLALGILFFAVTRFMQLPMFVAVSVFAIGVKMGLQVVSSLLRMLVNIYFKIFVYEVAYVEE